MMNIDTHKKYIDGEPNAYYEEFVADSEFYKGYRTAVDDLAEMLDSMTCDLFEDISVPMLKAFLSQTARVCSDYISETMEYNKNEMVIWLIDKMPASEWSEKRKQLFDVHDEMDSENVATRLRKKSIQFGIDSSRDDGYEEHDVCSEGTGIPEKLK